MPGDMTGKGMNYRWQVMALLFFATCINYLDRQIIGLLKPVLAIEFNWTETDFARIVMFFTAAYAIGYVTMGWLIDKMGTKAGFILIVLVWSTASVSHALAGSVLGFGLARLILGLGESGNFPASVKAIAEWFPTNERGIASGILNAGTSIGVLLALVVAPYLLRIYGWHTVFWVTGAVGFVWLIFWVIFYRDSGRHRSRSARERELTAADDAVPAESVVPWGRLFTMRATWAFIMGKFLIDPIYWFFLFWLPSYFSAIYHADIKKTSLPLICIYLATTAGSVCGGYLSDWLIRTGRTPVSARKISLLVFALTELGVMLALACFSQTLWISVSLLSIAAATHQAWSANIFTIASDQFPKSSVSSVVGIGGMAGSVGGILFPLLVGYVLDYFIAAGNLSRGYQVLFTICGFTYVTVWFIISLLTKENTRLKTSGLITVHEENNTL